MLFPIIDLMSPENFCQWLLDCLHPDGLKCLFIDTVKFLTIWPSENF